MGLKKAIDELWSGLSGKKTFLVSLATFIYAVGGYFGGYLDANGAVQLVLASLGLAGLRDSLRNKL
ncbi:hypothetical protein A2415_04535 [candidate division WWE3 bacterium RIFOXYC1_FULL_39_7]|uniref:Uncharacterized protein n=1 Tax=candidate division WWE3 bacterium RIFOXYC1_FULL_39_7 TaxID=1802643 RepID=A0A1F4WFZ1_UNCKA|nr:MAG: hypothetical protein A2415_04535 [candidate division WWE3 bacterium RIFOXYC1_FULL_39_7]